MQASACAIVLSSTATHAYWNFLLKRSGGGSTFVALSKLVEVIVFAPAFLWIAWRQSPWRHGALGLAVVGAALVLLNYAALARAYQTGELSLVYPVSRAGILLFLPIFGFLAFDERLTLGGWCALALIVSGIAMMQLSSFTRTALQSLMSPRQGNAIAFSLAAAFVAALYTVWDKRAVNALPAFVYFYSYTTLVAAGYSAFVLLQRSTHAPRDVWRSRWQSIVQVGVFNTVSYVLVLAALRGETSSYVVGLRQLSIVWGALLGRGLLGEAITPTKRVGIGLLVVGCAAVAVTR